MPITPYHAKYFAYELTRQRRGGDMDRISTSLFDAEVDINPHQIDAALFALQNPLSKGVLLADEVGLGKTIEGRTGAVPILGRKAQTLNYHFAQQHCVSSGPMSLAKNSKLPNQVLDAKTYNAQRKAGVYNPFEQETISIVSFNYAARMADKLRTTPWDFSGDR